MVSHKLLYTGFNDADRVLTMSEDLNLDTAAEEITAEYSRVRVLYFETDDDIIKQRW